MFESILSLRRANRRLGPVEPLGLALAQRGDHSVRLFLRCHFSFFELEPLEPPRGDEFKEQAPNESEWSYRKAVTILLQCKGYAAHPASTILHDAHLDGKSGQKNDYEHPIVAEMGEYIELTFSEFTWVDLVEQLHEYEGLKDDWVHQHFLSGLLQDPVRSLGVGIDHLLCGVEWIGQIEVDTENVISLEE